jgi:hypothetical protein
VKSQTQFHCQLGRVKAGEIALLPQLRHLQVQRPQPGVQRAVTVAITLGHALLGPFMAPGTDQAVDIALHH